MAARGSTLLAGGVVVGVAIALVIGMATPSYVNLLGDRTTHVSLVAINGPCTLGKETVVKGKEDKKLTWEVENACGEAQTVRVGNFRTTQNTANTNCDAGTEGGAAFPFKEDPNDVQLRTATVDPNKDKEIKLHIRKFEGTAPVPTYYFSICLGQTIIDPTLIIER